MLPELAWHTGARAGALVALALRDTREPSDGTRYLEFKDRPGTGTRLKKGHDGERPVLLSEEVWKAVDYSIEHDRYDVRDEYSRQPLLASRLGQASTNALRNWMYLATLPCLHSPCPHEKDPETCEWIAHAKWSQCPSSWSPHQVRTGAITWMLDRSIPIEARISDIRFHQTRKSMIRISRTALPWKSLFLQILV